MSNATWVLEPHVFDQTQEALRSAIHGFGLRLIDWSDAWWLDGVPVHVPSSRVVFHGSLGNAARIEDELRWNPGSFCPVKAFHCSSWYESARRWLVHRDWHIAPAIELVSMAHSVACALNSPDRLFVRPDSPLKPFSGRVVEVANMSLARLDHGFYYEDETIPVVAAPVREIGREWRFVVAAQRVIAGSAYDPATREPVSVVTDSEAASFASRIASELPPPADVYVLDICECDNRLHLLELNPFGGADLYGCDAAAVVKAVSEIAAA